MDTAASGYNNPGEQRPFFSIIIPMYNRAGTIRRCLDSILSQEFSDYQIVVVDDGSEDASVSVVESYLPHCRIKLIGTVENRGVCAARGLGVKHAEGRWFLFIGSDDAFNPGALRTIYAQASSAPEEVSEIRYRYYNKATGRLSPIPTMPEGILGFPEYLEWYGEVLNQKRMRVDSNVLYCQRRSIYDAKIISWPTDRQFESLYHFRLASRIKMIMSQDVVATVYDDAPDRLTRGPAKGKYTPLTEKELTINRDNANARAKVLEEYGESLKQYCPNVYEKLYSDIGHHYMRCGIRSKGCHYLLKYLRMHPFSISRWGMLALGLMGPNVTSWARHSWDALFVRDRGI
jgi:glycosyltransferase involved in cell wall biosynthesis